MKVSMVIALVLAALMSVAPVRGQETKEDWQPDPPLPDEFDWIQLTSLEWLKGEIIAMYEDELEFESDELDTLILDWEDIKQIRSAQIMQMLFVGGITATGKLVMDGERIRILGEQVREFDRTQVISIAAGDPTKRAGLWSGKVSLGANIREGNTDQVDLSSKVNIMRRSVVNRIVLDYIANYSEIEGTETTNSQRATANWDNFINDRLFWTVAFGEYFRDPFQNIDHRESISTLLGYQVADTRRVEWDVSAGPAYQQTTFVEVEEDQSRTESTPAFIGDTSLDLEVTKWIDFIYEYRFTLLNKESGTYTHHMVGTLETEITSLLDFDVSLIWDRVEHPKPDADGNEPEQDDYRLVLSLGLEF